MPLTMISDWLKKRKLHQMLSDPRATRGFRSVTQLEKGSPPIAPRRNDCSSPSAPEKPKPARNGRSIPHADLKSASGDAEGPAWPGPFYAACRQAPRPASAFSRIAVSDIVGVTASGSIFRWTIAGLPDLTAAS